jgi:hypothetical protein|tara:strand:+ start:100 stop:276 length:177 start_codon:yes stop_codon:yes gene_type:complete
MSKQLNEVNEDPAAMEAKEIWKAIREIRWHLQEKYGSDVDDFEVIIPCDIDEGGFKLS